MFPCPRSQCQATAALLESVRKARSASQPGSSRHRNPAWPWELMPMITEAVLVHVSLETVSVYVVVAVGEADGLALAGSSRPVAGVHW